MPTMLSSLVIVTIGILSLAFPAAAQTSTAAPADCEGYRQKLAAHAKLSDGVRRYLATLPREAPPAMAAPAAAPAAAGRGEAIRTRLQEIATQRAQLEEQRLGSLVKFEFGRASQIQTQIAQLDREKADLEREQASLPATPAVPAPAPTPAPAAAGDRVRCDQFPAAYETAIRIRQRELGAREGQGGAIPLLGLTGQTSEQIGQELAAQLGSDTAGKVGLLDQDGDGRLDAFLDAPAPDVFRLVRQRGDGNLAIEVFTVRGASAQYGDLARRLDEALARHARWTLADMLAMEPAGPVRVVGETGEFDRARAHLLAGNFADAGRLDGPAARSREFENARGEAVRELEVVTPTGDGVTVRRVLATARPGNQERWEELTIAIRTVSYWRSDVEVKGIRELRAPGAAATGRTAIGPTRFSLER